MEYINQLFTNEYLMIAIVSWFIAQAIKVILTLIKDKHLDFTRLFGSGGMPSSHASFTVSLATAIGFKTSFNSIEFALAAAFAIVVMYDATGVRRSAGEQAKILNKIVDSMRHEKFTQTGEKLKELLGHTPFEVFWGAVLGIAVAVFYYFCI